MGQPHKKSSLLSLSTKIENTTYYIWHFLEMDERGLVICRFHLDVGYIASVMDRAD